MILEIWEIGFYYLQNQTNQKTMSDISKLPENLDAQVANLLELAEADMKAGRHEEAISFYNNILGLDPKLAYVWYQKGMAVFGTSTLGNCRFLESKTYFEKAINLSDNDETRMTVSETIVDLAKSYFPSYEKFFMDHYAAPSSVVSLFEAYNEFDSMIYWATELCPSNQNAYVTGWNLCREIIEMPKKYVELQAKIASQKKSRGGNDISAEIDYERAQEVKRNLDRYTNIVFKNAKKYEKGIQGISELKQLIKHFDSLFSSKPNVSSEGKTFEAWEADEKSSNKIHAIVGGIFGILFIYNWWANGMNIWTIIWGVIGAYGGSRPIFNDPTQEKYDKQQGDLSNWIKKSHDYINTNDITAEELTKLSQASKSVYETYYYFTLRNDSEKPSHMSKLIQETFLKANATYKVQPKINLTKS